MGKKLKVNIEYKLDWTYAVEIQKIRKDLDAIELLGATHVDIVPDLEYDCPIVTIQAYVEREETEEDIKLRLKLEEEKKALIEANERQQLMLLKLKYENVKS
jgi:hypothetical protein